MVDCQFQLILGQGTLNAEYPNRQLSSLISEKNKQIKNVGVIGQMTKITSFRKFVLAIFSQNMRCACFLVLVNSCASRTG